jgi:redox-sensitive bicupin YhaK (pirin superfamily)
MASVPGFGSIELPSCCLDCGAVLPGPKAKTADGFKQGMSERCELIIDARRNGGEDPPGRRKTLPVETDRHAFAYVFEGSGTFSSASQPFGVLTERVGDRGGTPIRERAGNRSLVLFDSGDEVTVQASEEGIRFLLVSGKPIEEPVAWHGPIVINTEAELEQAYAELRNGTFSKREALTLL